MPGLARACPPALLLSLSLACTPKTSSSLSTPETESSAQSSGAGSSGSLREEFGAEHELISLQAHGVDDMILATERLLANWMPPEPGGSPIKVLDQAALYLSMVGIGPGLLESLDLRGLHLAEVSSLHSEYEGRLSEDTEFYLSLATQQPERMLGSLPPDIPVNELGPQQWSLEFGGPPIMLYARNGALDAASSGTQLDAVAAARAQADIATQPRLLAYYKNPELADAELHDLFGDLPGLQPQMLDQLDTLDMKFSVDFGTDRDLYFGYSVEAEFGALGSSAPRIQAPTKLAQSLPAGPLYLLQQTWGPEALESERWRAMWSDMEAEWMQELFASPELLAGFGQEFIHAAYYDAKGRASFVFALEVADRARVTQTTDRLRQQMIDDAKRQKWKVDYRPAGLRLAARKADYLLIEDKDVDFARANPWLVRDGKPKLELALLTTDDSLYFVFGAGTRELLKIIDGRIDAPSGASADEDLARVRELTQGCQSCWTVDLPSLAAAVLDASSKGKGKGKSKRQAAEAGLAQLRNLQLEGELDFAIGYGPQGWDSAIVLSKQLLFADAEGLRALWDTLELFVSGFTDSLVEGFQEGLEGGYSEAEICAHAIEVVRNDAPPGVTVPSPEEVEKMMAKCEADLLEDKRTNPNYEADMACVMAAQSLDEIVECDAV